MSLVTCWCLVLVVALAVMTGISSTSYLIESTVLWIFYTVACVGLLIVSICNDVANARAAVHHLPEMDA